MAASMQKIMKHTDLLAAGAVVLVVVMMIVPLPPFMLDMFITLNISSALAVLVATLYMPRALDFAAFPSLLLLTTLFRLAINVSVTRLILCGGGDGRPVGQPEPPLLPPPLLPPLLGGGLEGVGVG